MVTDVTVGSVTPGTACGGDPREDSPVNYPDQIEWVGRR
jgi:hypothetical protein